MARRTGLRELFDGGGIVLRRRRKSEKQDRG
jgi:hypothetical protein